LIEAEKVGDTCNVAGEDDGADAGRIEEPMAMKARNEAMNGTEVRGFARGSWVVFVGRRARMCWKEEGIAWEQQNG
jgi:hypothetical protein